MSARDNNFSYQDSVSLRDYVEARLQAVEHGIELARQVMDKRLDSMNEFREQLKDQAGRFITREEYVLAHDRLREDVKGLEMTRAEAAGKASMTSVFVAIALAVSGLLVGIINAILRLQ